MNYPSKVTQTGCKIGHSIHKLRGVSAVGIAGIVAMLAAYSAPAADFSITYYGAKGEAAALETTAIQNAIDAAFDDGGGRVVVPAGRFRSGSLTLKDNVTLRLDTPDSVLAGSDNYRDYNGAFINAGGGVAKRIEGPGMIDGVNCYNAMARKGFAAPTASLSAVATGSALTASPSATSRLPVWITEWWPPGTLANSSICPWKMSKLDSNLVAGLMVVST